MTLGVIGMAGCPNPQEDYDDYLKVAQKPVPTSTATTEPTSKCPAAAIEGLFVGYCKVSFAEPEQALMLRTEFTVADGKLSAVFKPLRNSAKVGPASTEDVIGDPIVTSGPLTDNQFTLDAGTVNIPGEANPISGSLIQVDASEFKGFTISDDLVFAELQGSLIKPFTFDLSAPGDNCVFVRATGTEIPARPTDALKTPSVLGSGCPDEGAAGSGGSGGEAGGGGEAGSGGSGS